MKRLFIILASAAAIIGCIKEKPDDRQVSCKHVQYLKQAFVDSAAGGTQPIGKPAVAFDGQLCQEELNRAEAWTVKWEQLCDADGIKYWIKLYTKIY